MSDNMNQIIFNDMNKKKRALYECMWGSIDFNFPVEKTKIRNSVSNNSYTFKGTSSTDEAICRNRLAQLFGISEPDLFKEKFAQSCSGSGQELNRIATLHSSSLCALLFFYNVSERNPYTMEIKGKEYTFTYSCFEYQNTVIKGRNPSNIDVVLIGTEKSSGKAAVFFLESKFSEYYESAGRPSEIAAAYFNNRYGKDLYSEDNLAAMGLSIKKAGNKNSAPCPDKACHEVEKKNFTLCSEEACYVEGIKQMISHYIGVRNLCDKPDKKNDPISNAISAEADVLLGEILFTKGIGQLPIENGEECFASYQKKYSILADILNKQLKRDGMSGRITVLKDILSYSQFQDAQYIREQQIRSFYFESGKQI